MPIEAMEEQALRQMFYTVSTFDVKGEEYVAMVEGKRAPIFGFLYSPQKSQLTTETMTHMPIDQSMKARYHAQFLANYIVDSARESPNRFDSYEEERRLLINRFQTVFVEERVTRQAKINEKTRHNWSSEHTRAGLKHTQSIYALSFGDIRYRV